MLYAHYKSDQNALCTGILISNNPDESSKGYTLYFSLDCPCEKQLLRKLKKVYDFTIGKNGIADNSARVFADTAISAFMSFREFMRFDYKAVIYHELGVQEYSRTIRKS